MPAFIVGELFPVKRHEAKGVQNLRCGSLTEFFQDDPGTKSKEQAKILETRTSLSHAPEKSFPSEGFLLLVVFLGSDGGAFFFG